MFEELLSPDAVVAGKYRVERVIGRGGMGVVVAARHLQLGQRVALKFLLPEAFGVPEAVQRFLREARAVVQIQSEHVARVIDFGTLDSGTPYIVMEYLNGSDLAAVLQAQGFLSVSDGVDYILQACEAIAEAHALGMVHRDLKPGNLFLTRGADGSPMIKVLDFGIAKALELDPTTGSPASVTRTDTLMGTPLYVSPEQIRSSKDVDARSDIWSIGVILQELLTGSMVFSADSAFGVLAKIVADPPPSLRSRLAGAPAELEAVILRCLEKDRERRYKNIGELAHALQRFGSPEARASAARVSRILGTRTDEPLPAASTAIAPQMFEPTLAESGNTKAWGYTQQLPRRKWKAPVLIVGALLLASCALLFALPSFRKSAVATRADVDHSSKAQEPKPQAATAPASVQFIPASPSNSSPAEPVAPPPPVTSFGSGTAELTKAPPRPMRPQSKSTPRPAPALAPTKKARGNLDAFDDTH